MNYRRSYNIMSPQTNHEFVSPLSLSNLIKLYIFDRLIMFSSCILTCLKSLPSGRSTLPIQMFNPDLQGIELEIVTHECFIMQPKHEQDDKV